MEEVFDDLLRFLFSDADQVYDMDRGFEFLEKELAEMHPEPDKRPDTRFAGIAKRLLKRGFPQKKVWAILKFLKNYVQFEDPEMNRTFAERIKSYDKNNVMGIYEYVKMEGKEEGLAEGLAEGRKESSRLFVQNLLKETDFSTKKIASLANVTVKFVNKIKRELKDK